MNWQNKTVWITGASSGIGEALAYQLAEKGTNLILSSRKKDALEAVKAKCAFPEKVIVSPLDLADAESIATTAKQVLANHQIDILVNNGGISQRSLLAETSMEVYRKLMEVNYFGTIHLSKIVLEQFIKNKRGHFVNVTSLMGRFSSQYRSGYCGSKHALHGFFDCLRLEHDADNVKVTMVCPGFVKTRISFNALTADGSPQDYMDKMQAQGLTSGQCAKKMIRGIEREKHEVYIGKREVMGIYLKRFFPGLLHQWLLRAQVK